MGTLHVHNYQQDGLHAILAHVEKGSEVKSLEVYRESGPDGVCLPPLIPGEYICWQDDLFLSKRGMDMLIVEPETAQWTVLQDRAFSLFSLCRYPRPFRELHDNPFLSPSDTEAFFSFLLQKNMLRRPEWPLLHPPVMPEPFHSPTFFSIHVTESCNFGCTYCYGNAPSSGKKMKRDVALAIIDRIFDDFFTQDITIEFHGGEPLLAKKVVADACRRIREREARVAGRRCTILLQTNGSLITTADIEMFRRFDISVGVSMDGPRDVHDSGRVYRDGRGTFDDTMRGFSLLRDHGVKGGVLAVVSDPHRYVDQCRFMLECGVTGFRLNHMVCQGRGEVQIDEAEERGALFAREFMELLDFLECYIDEHPGLFLDIWPLNVMLFHLTSAHRPFMCMRSPCGAGSQGLGFDYRGDIYPCEQLAGFPELKAGSALDERGIRTVLSESPVIDRMKKRRVESIDACRQCPWRNFCGGGCTAESFSVFRDLSHGDIQCNFYRIAFENLMWEMNRRDLSPLLGQFGRTPHSGRS